MLPGVISAQLFPWRAAWVKYCSTAPRKHPPPFEPPKNILHNQMIDCYWVRLHVKLLYLLWFSSKVIWRRLNAYFYYPYFWKPIRASDGFVTFDPNRGPQAEEDPGLGAAPVLTIFWLQTYAGNFIWTQLQILWWCFIKFAKLYFVLLGVRIVVHVSFRGTPMKKVENPCLMT